MSSGQASPSFAGILAAGLGLALFAAGLTLASQGSNRESRTNENLLTQLGQEGRAGRRLGIYDTASGLYNRAYLELRLQEEFHRCHRYAISMSLVVVRFGSVALMDYSNDGWGSLAYDLARKMANTVRAVDITAALAPREFAICLVHCDRDGAERAIDRLLRDLDSPVEIGLAVYPDDNFEPRALVELARGRAHEINSTKQAA